MAIPIVHADTAVGAVERFPLIGGRVCYRGQHFQGRCEFIRHGNYQLADDAGNQALSLMSAIGGLVFLRRVEARLCTRAMFEDFGVEFDTP